MARSSRLSSDDPRGSWRRGGAARVAAMAVSMLVAACGMRLSTPPTGPHPAGSTHYVEVPYPPPPARVEIVPPQPPDPGAVWVDGEWAWHGKHWVWQAGGWVLRPPAGYFAPWLVYRLGNGRLLFAPGAWHAISGERLPNPVVLEPARNGLDDEGSPSQGTPRSSTGSPSSAP
jgi:hypothetical protein